MTKFESAVIFLFIFLVGFLIGNGLEKVKNAKELSIWKARATQCLELNP